MHHHASLVTVGTQLVRAVLHDDRHVPLAAHGHTSHTDAQLKLALANTYTFSRYSRAEECFSQVRFLFQGKGYYKVCTQLL